LAQPCVASSCVRRRFVFLRNRLCLRSTQRLSSAGGEFYSVQTRCQPPLSTAFDPPDRSTNRAKPPPRQPGAFYVNPPSVQAFDLANFLICKRFCRRPAPEKVRIIGTSNLASTAI